MPILSQSTPGEKVTGGPTYCCPIVVLRYNVKAKGTSGKKSQRMRLNRYSAAGTAAGCGPHLSCQTGIMHQALLNVPVNFT